MNTLNPIWILAAQALLYGVDEVPLGSNSAILAESFATQYRSSGAGLTYQLAGFVVGVIVALILPVLLVSYGVVGSWQPIVWVSIAVTVLAIVASYFVKETRGSTLE